MSKHVGHLYVTSQCVDELLNEQQKVTMYHKNVARQAQLLAAWLQKRRAENQSRRAAGLLG